jgi:oxygen-dependent protoporphyrinogen oxidase
MRVAVIGGGLAGLASAYALVGAGFDAHVLEADHAGGVIGTSHLDGFVRESAASSFLGGPARGALALCNELGVPVDKASPQAKRRWIFIDGKLRALPRGPVELVRSDLLTWRGKLALFREPLAKKRGTEDESMHAFAARRFGPEAARSIFAPFVTGVFAADSHAISLEAGFPRLAELDAAGGIVRGSLKKLFSRDKSEKTPRGMYAPQGGLGKLIDALVVRLGSRIRKTTVTSITPQSKGVLVDGQRWDAAVLATPAEAGAALVGCAIPELAERLRVFHRAPVALVYLGVPAASVPKAADGFGFLVAQGEELRVLGVVFETTVWAGRAPEGQALLRCIIGGGRDPEAVGLPDAELVALAIRDVGRALDAKLEPTHTSVIRWDRGIAQYPIGHRDAVRAAVAAARVHRIALTGADYRGAGVNDIIADRDVVVAELQSWT